MKKLLTVFITLAFAVSVFVPVLTLKARAQGNGVSEYQPCGYQKLSGARVGEVTDAVKNLQRCLIELGFSINAGPTGYFGNQTVGALKLFYERLAGIKVNGRIFGPIGLGTFKKVFDARKNSGKGDKSAAYVRVTSKEELRDYFNQARTLTSSRILNFGLPGGALEERGRPLSAPAVDSLKSDSAGRVSETNVQVKGIDEPDIVKTDGRNIYFSREPRYYILPAERNALDQVKPSIVPPREPEQRIVTVKALPPADLAVLGKIDEQGELLLIKDKNILVVFHYDGFSGYDISDPKNPKKKWSTKYESNTSLVTSRLTDGKIYVVTRKWQYDNDPCPLPLLKIGNQSVIVPCKDIWRPIQYVPADSTFTVMTINPATGSIEKNTSFVGSSQGTTVYVSNNAIYLGNYEPRSQANLTMDFILEDGSSIYPNSVIEKVKKIKSYDLSESGRDYEVNQILRDYERTLSADEQLRVQNELTNRMNDYVKKRKRDLEKTVIVKIRLSDLSIAATGRVPGQLLNQFSMDEHEGYLRTAVTISGRGSWFWGGGESVNDVYVLDSAMGIVGSVENLGVSERIFSARFVGDKGYLVTFRQIDPFYVLDLSNPRNPKLAGELKIPGFSSYLHPISESRILGVGQEGQSVKLSLFDVANPGNPREVAKYALDEYWTEVQTNHRAFLLDDKHGIFFIPGSKGAYVFSYKNDKLELAKTLSTFSVKRAVYLDDYLYIVSEDGIKAFDERNWQKTGEVVF